MKADEAMAMAMTSEQAGELLHLLMGISNEHNAQPDDPATFLARVTDLVLNRAYRMGYEAARRSG